ncbi:PEPxxWA-CTERM sorting domain-containing protein [Sphingomonas sp. TREG-RG-20F-R18-01]|uniref:PEPxxWA-CTERM sorting domain-containing protein n=1 Tax=Sphingomonas sp. TREG-RG-20F-R18-01 TaxID=2914982 RepID=UPI001F581B59|nr:PEPxxWA-CTERM sorting domain-containing protein [Sphingomonas sp. TREG-RG-20F-R18-01]
MRKLAIALCALIGLSAAPANALTIVQTATNLRNYINQFNPSLGTLNSVTITSSYVKTYFFAKSYSYPGAVLPTINAIGTIYTNGLAAYDFTGAYQANVVNPENISFGFSATATGKSSLNLSQYIGTGTAGLFEGTGDTSFSIDGLAIQPTDLHFPTLATDQYTVTYDFTAFGAGVPEPSTWALMLVGFGSIGLAMRRRRTDVLRPSDQLATPDTSKHGWVAVK